MWKIRGGRRLLQDSCFNTGVLLEINFIRWGRMFSLVPIRSFLRSPVMWSTFCSYVKLMTSTVNGSHLAKRSSAWVGLYYWTTEMVPLTVYCRRERIEMESSSLLSFYWIQNPPRLPLTVATVNLSCKEGKDRVISPRGCAGNTALILRNFVLTRTEVLTLRHHANCKHLWSLV